MSEWDYSSVPSWQEPQREQALFWLHRVYQQGYEDSLNARRTIALDNNSKERKN